ncbi:MAG TPA: DUF5666 domain-containing protein [Vicinamibacterales bacterium]|jgi:hypothetical protein|nr:DUF5666 domain-containing protein [Vicinamibacterales bacterium]
MKRTILAAMIVAVTACGGDASLSPVGPSRSSSSAGASISGTVSGTGVTATRALDGGAFSLLATSSVTVSIAGTNISTTTDGQGQFTLNNVPEGTVTLNFTAPGSSATITLTGIGPDDKVQIQVTLNGNNAKVDSEHHSSPGNDKKEFQGRISSIDAAAKSFQIPGLTVKTTATTTIRHGNRTFQFSDLKVGDHVQARGTKDGTTLTATEIKVENDNDDDDDDDHDKPTTVSLSGVVSGSTGTCPAVTFTVQSTKVTVNSGTTYSSTTCADATKNAANVKVTGTKQADGSVLATSVSLTTPAPTTLTGFISASAGTCPAVTFTVQSTKVTVNSSTTFPSTTCADATKNDANVTVTGTKQADGSVVATSVALVPPTTLTGAVSASTGTCPAVTFTVQSTKVTVSSSTAYTSTTCAVATVNGANVKVTGPKLADGSVQATTVALAP